MAMSISSFRRKSTQHLDLSLAFDDGDGCLCARDRPPVTAAALDLFGNPVTPPLRVRLDRQIDRDKPCCDNVAIVGPGNPQHAAEIRCASCDAHRGWLPKQAFDFILETSRR